MRSFAAIIFFSVFPAFVFCQSPEEEIDPENINVQYMEHLIKKKIDSVRLAKGLLELVNDSILYVASKHHSVNMAKTRSLSHYEALPKFKNPQKRAEAFGAVNYFTGENVALLTAYKRYNVKDPSSSEFFTYGEFATRMVKAWVKSRGHYRNIIKKEYQITGVTINYDKRTKRIYATQKFAEVKSKFVFTENTAMFPYEDDNQIEYELKELKQVSTLQHKGKHRWRLKKRKRFRRCRECDAVPTQKNNLKFYVDSSFNVHCITTSPYLFKRLTKRRRDGFALETVKYEDYVCSRNDFFLKPSRRNGECIANGNIQKPVYKWKLRKEYRRAKLIWNLNKWKQIRKILFFRFKRYGELPKRIIQKFPGIPSDNIIGKLPKDPKEYYEANILFLKKRRVCQILNFTDYCGEYFSDIKPTPLLPELSDKEYHFPEDTIHYNFSIQFKQGKSDYHYEDIKPLLDTLKLENYHIVRLQINASASVEGDEEKNSELTLKRSLSIRKALDSTGVDTLVKDIHAKEDWDHFYKAIVKTKYSYLKKSSKEDIKKELLKPEIADALEPILREERKAKISLWLMAKVNDSIRLKFAFARYKQLIEDAHVGKLNGYDAMKLHSIQTLMYKYSIKGKIPFSKLTELVPPNHPLYDKIYLNYVIFKRESDTTKSKDEYDRELYEALKTVAVTNKATQTQRYNFLTILVNHWDSLSWYDPTDPEKIQPKKIFGYLGKLNNSVIPKDTMDRLKLNFNFKAANWFQFIDPDDNYQLRAVNNIYYYYRSRKNTDSTALKMAKYFIFYEHHDHAYRILTPFAIKKDPNHELFSLYLKMAYLRDMYRQRSRFYRLMKTAPGILTKEEYCGLFTGPCNMSFQIFDHEDIRTTWCKTCNDHKNFADLWNEAHLKDKK